MAIEIMPLEDQDTQAYSRISNLAFAGSVMGFLNPNPDDPDERMMKMTRDSMLNDPTARYMKAVDSETGDIVACAKWNYYDKERTPEEVAEANKPRPRPPNANPEAWNDLFTWLERVRVGIRGAQISWCKFLRLL